MSRHDCTLWPIAREFGSAYRLTVRCDACEGTGTSGEEIFSDCLVCYGTGEIEIDPAEMMDDADV